MEMLANNDAQTLGVVVNLSPLPVTFTEVCEQLGGSENAEKQYTVFF
jgi:hypothetical protein